jgi:GTP-binding protein
LRHIERTRLLVHLIDVSAASDRDPVQDFHVIMAELASFDPKLAEKPIVVVASKIDAAQNPERIEKLKSFCQERGLPFFEISAVTGAGLDVFKLKLAERAYNRRQRRESGDLRRHFRSCP